jgi:hypothetical protein
LGNVLLLCALLCFIRLPLAWGQEAALNPVLQWLALAERMAAGDIPYAHLWDDTSPLSALVYYLLYVCFGKSLWPYTFFGSLLLFVQALWWSRILNQSRIFEERTQVPALLYVLAGNLFFDFQVLSPLLMANTFLMLSLGHIFSHINENVQRPQVFEVGLYLGIAGMFYVPYFVFLGLPVLAFLLFTGTKARDYLLLFFSFLLPLSILLVLYFLLDAEQAFVEKALLSVVQLPELYYVDALSLLLLSFLPFVWLLVSFLRLLQQTRYINYQIRCQQVMFLGLFFAGASFFFQPSIAGFSLMVFLPMFSFFLGHFFLLIRRVWLAELIFACFLAPLALLPLALQQQWIPLQYQYIATDKLFAQSPALKNTYIEGKKVWTSGSDLGLYRVAPSATAYLNARYLALHLKRIEQYRMQSDIYAFWMRDMPDTVIDPEGLVPQVFVHIPALALRYEQVAEGLYVRK